jgi:hypothetical protein
VRRELLRLTWDVHLMESTGRVGIGLVCVRVSASNVLAKAFVIADANIAISLLVIRKKDEGCTSEGMFFGEQL